MIPVQKLFTELKVISFWSLKVWQDFNTKYGEFEFWDITGLTIVCQLNTKNSLNLTILWIWVMELLCFIIALIKVSLLSSIGKDRFYLRRTWVPTGGSLCGQLANITMFYIINKVVYTKPELMANAKEAKQYIDDGAGFFIDLKRKFYNMDEYCQCSIGHIWSTY